MLFVIIVLNATFLSNVWFEKDRGWFFWEIAALTLHRSTLRFLLKSGSSGMPEPDMRENLTGIKSKVFDSI